MLKGLTPTVTFEDGKAIDVATSIELQRIAEMYLGKIKLKIQEFNYNPSTGQANREPGDQVYILAQEYLLPLMASQAVLFNPKVLARLLPGLQGIKTALSAQHSQDYELLQLCNRYIAMVEKLPTFQIAKAVFDSVFNNVGAADDIINMIRNGDLSGLVGILDVTNILTEVSNMALCFSVDLNMNGINSLKDGV